MRNHLTVWCCVLLAALIFRPAPGLAQGGLPPDDEKPETFVADARAQGTGTGVSATVTIHLDRFTLERHRTNMLTALKEGGYPRLLTVLRSTPDVGYVEMNGRKVLVRWARQVPKGKGRSISIVTERPLAFVGGAAIDAKSRAGYELAILQFDLDANGSGSGTMAAAARVKPGGETGVQLDDYAETPITLTVKKTK